MVGDHQTSPSRFFSKIGNENDNTYQLNLKDVPTYLQSRNLIPTPFGNRFSIASSSIKNNKDKNNEGSHNDNDNENSRISPKKELIDNKDSTSSALESSENNDVMAIGWKKHVSTVQKEIDNILFISFQQTSVTTSTSKSDHPSLQNANSEQRNIQIKIESFLSETFGSRFATMIVKRYKEEYDENSMRKSGESNLLNAFTFHDIDALLSKIQTSSKDTEDDVNSTTSSYESPFIQKWKNVQKYYHQSNSHIAHATRLLSCAKKYDLPKLVQQSNKLCTQQKVEQEQMEKGLIPCYKEAIDNFQKLQLALGISLLDADDITSTLEKEEGTECKDFSREDVIKAIQKDELNQLFEEIEQIIAVVVSEGSEKKYQGSDAVYSGKLLEAMSYYEQFIAAVTSITTNEKEEKNRKMENLLPTLSEVAKELCASDTLSTPTDDENGGIYKQESYLLSKSTRSGLIDDLLELKGFVYSRLFEERANLGEKGGEYGSRSIGAAGTLSISQNINSLLPTMKSSNIDDIVSCQDTDTNSLTQRKLEEYKSIIENIINKLTSGRFAMLTLMNEDVTFQSTIASKLSNSYNQIKRAKNCIDVSKQNLKKMKQEETIARSDIQLLERRMQILHKALEKKIGSLIFGNGVDDKEGGEKIHIDL